jgi:hypothetical protein
MDAAAGCSAAVSATMSRIIYYVIYIYCPLIILHDCTIIWKYDLHACNCYYYVKALRYSFIQRLNGAPHSFLKLCTYVQLWGHNKYFLPFVIVNSTPTICITQQRAILYSGTGYHTSCYHQNKAVCIFLNTWRQ